MTHASQSTPSLSKLEEAIFRFIVTHAAKKGRNTFYKRIERSVAVKAEAKGTSIDWTTALNNIDLREESLGRPPLSCLVCSERTKLPLGERWSYRCIPSRNLEPVKQSAYNYWKFCRLPEIYTGLGILEMIRLHNELTGLAGQAKDPKP